MEKGGCTEMRKQLLPNGRRTNKVERKIILMYSNYVTFFLKTKRHIYSLVF
jgi:hypothetical protein